MTMEALNRIKVNQNIRRISITPLKNKTM